MTQIQEVKGYVKVYANNDLKYILFDWESFNISLEDMKNSFEKSLQYMIKNDIKTYIAGSGNVKNALSQDILKWFEGEWIPTMNKNGIELVVTILPKSSIGNLSTKSWQKPVDVGNIRLVNVLSMEEAEDYIKQYRIGKK
jgi:hypothetical protein